MNDSTLTQLKTIVERAVRPVRASIARKMKMRKELLAHVSDVFEEEAKLGEERAALERTAQRFGNPVELTGQLQEAVGATDALDRLLDWVWFGSCESMRVRLRRYACLNAMILLVLLPTWYLWILLGRWAARAVAWPAEEERLLGSPVLLLDCFFFAFAAGILVWGLAKIDRERTARIRADGEWAGLPIDA